MRRSFLIIAALAALCTASRAQAGATASARRGADEKVRAELRKLHQDINEAVARRDRAALERLYADEFVYIHSTGHLETKAEWIPRSLTINRSRTIEPASPPPAGE